MASREVSSEHTAVSDDAVLGGLSSGGGANCLEFVKNFKATSDRAEDDVLAIEVGSGCEAHEELGAVSVGAGVGHRENTSTCVSVGEVLIFESATVDGLTAATIASGEVTSLGHEAGNDTMELAALEVEGLTLLSLAFLASAEALGVLSSAGSVGSVESHLNSASSLAADGDIEEYFGHFEVG